jgi:hypothetical protein
LIQFVGDVLQYAQAIPVTILISILVTNFDISRIRIDHEIPDTFKTCECCAKLPIYRKITSIIIDNKNNFEVNYNSFYVPV